MEKLIVVVSRKELHQIRQEWVTVYTFIARDYIVNLPIICVYSQGLDLVTKYLRPLLLLQTTSLEWCLLETHPNFPYALCIELPCHLLLISYASVVLLLKP